MPLGRGQVFADRFEILGVAGAGAMGVVYRATDRHAGGTVALKVVSADEPRRVERWSREARALAELTHPGLPRYVAHGLAPRGERWIAMEWLEGEDLAHRLAYGRLGLADSVTLCMRVAEALGAAHAAGIVHRDVKPSNLFLPGGLVERVKILDFGVARWRRGTRDETRAGARVGTPRYMAPEQARGARDLDGRVDIFALGCVLFYCLTGRHAFSGDDELAVLAKILLDEAPRPSEVAGDVPPEMDRLVGRMLAKDPAARPRDCDELCAELGRLQAADGSRPGQERTAGGLGAVEQRLLSVVVVGGVDQSGSGDEPAPAASPDETQPLARPSGARGAVESAVVRHGGLLETLPDGAMVVTVTAHGAATDQAAQAARLALALRGLFPVRGLAVATGRAVVAGESPVGEVIDRAARLLRAEETAGTARGVRLCDVTAGLLDGRFEVEGGERLLGERDGASAGRTLLGQPSPLVGRDLEMSMLRGVYAECAGEPVARAVLLTAEPGVGKSRLCRELIAWVGREDEPPQVWECEGDPLRAGSPYGMLAPALRRAAGILDGEHLALRRDKLRARVARHVPAVEAARVAEFLGEMCGIPFSDENSVQLRAARADPVLMADQLRRAFEDLVRAECLDRPLLLVLDDLHWGDLPTVRACDAALRAAHDLPFMVLALARPEIDHVFARLWEGRRLTRLQLGELSRKACERLITRVLGRVDAALAARLVEHAAGNAFFLEELIRTAGAGAAGGELPPTVLAMLHARLEEQPPEARRLLRAASIYGVTCWRGGLLALLGPGADPALLDGWLEHLTQHELLLRRPEASFPDEQELAFRHALMREAAYATLTEHDRMLGHRLAAVWLRQAGASDALVLAEHTARGGEPGAAADLYLEAATAALEGDDLAAALARADLGIACGATAETLGGLWLVRAEASSWRGELVEAERCAEAALRALPRGSRGWYQAAGELAGVAGKTGHGTLVDELALRLLEDGHAGGTGRELVLAATRVGVSLLFAGRYELGGELTDLADGLAAGLLESDPAVAAAVHRARAIRALTLGDQAAGLVHWPAAIAACEQAGNRRGALLARGNLANRYKVLGGYAQAEGLLVAVLADADRLGLGTVSALAKQNLGVVLAALGRTDDALVSLRASVAELEVQGDRRLEAASRAHLAHTLTQAGRPADAVAEARRAVDRAQHSRPTLPFALALLAEAELAAGDGAAALVASTEAMRILDEVGGLDEGDAVVRLAHVRALRAAGQDSTATSEDARARLLAAAARISDPAWRRSFLEQVPENRATLAG